MASRNIAKAVALFAAPLMLAACGGGAGGPSGPAGSSFVGFSSTKAPGTTSIKGIGREASAKDDAQITISPFSPVETVTADLSMAANGDISELALTTSSGRKVWNRSNSQIVENQGILGAISDNGQESILVAEPEAHGFEYQTFGAWESSNATHTDGKFGAFSVGAETTGSSIPTSGTATFSGAAGGIYSDASGSADVATSDASLAVNFANRSAAFATTGTELAQEGLRPDLDLSGNLTYSPGSNILSGTVNNAAGTMSGNADGRFYGPAAQEIGGVFALKGTATNSLETFGGGFGAKR